MVYLPASKNHGILYLNAVILEWHRMDMVPSTVHEVQAIV